MGTRDVVDGDGVRVLVEVLGHVPLLARQVLGEFLGVWFMSRVKGA